MFTILILWLKKQFNSIKYFDEKSQCFPRWLSLSLSPYCSQSCSRFFFWSTGITTENLCIDLYYWFDKSSKRKCKFTEYFEFCHQEYSSILKAISVSWLFWNVSWTEYCTSNLAWKYIFYQSFSDKKFERLDEFSRNPLTEPALLFQSNAVKFFTHFNPILPNAPFWSPRKHQKTFGFLMFSGYQKRTLERKGLISYSKEMNQPFTFWEHQWRDLPKH